MIIFEWVRFKNFISYGNYWTTINLQESPTTCITGKNGNGKSTLLDALCFSLFGKPFRSVKKGSLVNSINKKDCQVEISFKVNGKSYRVLRGIGPNVFEIYRDGEIINQTASTKDYQEILERGILKFNFKSFTQIVILGAASYTPFMQLSASERRSFIEDLLDIQVFSSMGEVIKEKIIQNKENIIQEKAEINLLKQKYEIEKKHAEERERDGEERIRQLEEEYNLTHQSLQETKEAVKDLKKTIEEKETLLEDTKSLQDQMNTFLKYEASAEGRIKRLEKDIKFFTDNATCPTCRQGIDSEFKEYEVSKYKEEVKNLKSGLELLGKKKEVIEGKIKISQDMIREINNLKVKLSGIIAKGRAEDKTLKSIQVRIGELKTPQRVSTNLEGILEDIDEREEILSGYLEEKLYHDTATTLLKDSGIKSKIIKQYLPIINSEINAYLTKFDFCVNFNLDETFKETINVRHREDMTYNNFSEGEKARINLAILLAWRKIAHRRNSANTNLLILDEVFDSSMDFNGIDSLLDILHSMEDINIFVISHKGDVLTDKFSRLIEVTRSKNFSKIKVSNGN
jgi:DNA repair exonuclease SbcCD ATPase subunit